MMLHRDLGGVLDLFVRAAERRGKPGRRHGRGEPTSPWQPTSAPEIEALCLMSAPIAAAVSRKILQPCAVDAVAVIAIVADAPPA